MCGFLGNIEKKLGLVFGVKRQEIFIAFQWFESSRRIERCVNRTLNWIDTNLLYCKYCLFIHERQMCLLCYVFYCVPIQVHMLDVTCQMEKSTNSVKIRVESWMNSTVLGRSVRVSGLQSSMDSGQPLSCSPIQFYFTTLIWSRRGLRQRWWCKL